MIFSFYNILDLISSNTVVICLMICSLILINLGTKNTILLGISFFLMGLSSFVNSLVTTFAGRPYENFICSLMFISSTILMGYFYLNQFIEKSLKIRYFKILVWLVEITLVIMLTLSISLDSETLFFVEPPILIIITLYFFPIGFFSLIKLTIAIIKMRKLRPVDEKNSSQILYIINISLLIFIVMAIIQIFQSNAFTNFGYSISVILITYGYYLLGRFDTLKLRMKELNRIKIELEDTNENYRAIVKTTMNLILRCDSKGFIEYVNPGSVEFLHQKPQDMVKKNIVDYIEENDIRLMLRVLDKLNNGDIISNLEFAMIGKHNQTMYVIGNFSPIFTSGQKMRGFIAIINNITTQKTVTNRMNQFMNYLYLINDFSMIGMNLKIHSIEFLEEVLPKIGSSFRLTRISFLKDIDKMKSSILIDWRDPNTPKEAQSTDLFDAYSIDELKLLIEKKEISVLPVTKKEKCNDFFVIKAINTRNGIYGYILLEIYGIEALNRIKEYSIVIDNLMLTIENVISLLEYRYSLEIMVDERTNNLLRTTEELKNEVKERKKLELVLKDALKGAMSSNEAKNIFLANLSHELRTPLNAIIGFSEILIDKFETEKKSEEREFANNINESGKFLLTYISKILDLSKLESGMQKINIETFSIDILLEHVVSNYKDLIEKKELTILTNINPPDLLCRTDFDRIKLILCNIFENSILYTENKGKIDIFVKAEREYNKEYIIFTISDNGVGIPEIEQQKIFSPFVHIENPIIKMNQRSGLGLYISKLYTETLGGRIWFNSSNDRGTIFNISIEKNIDRP